MSEVVTEPASVVGTPAGVTVTGAATAAAALSDESDSSWVELSANDARLKLSIAAPTPPAGQQVAWVRWRIRLKKVINAPGTAIPNLHPVLNCVLDGQCGRALPGRPWDGIGMQTSTTVTWQTITQVRVQGGQQQRFGLPIDASPTNITLLLMRDDGITNWKPLIYQVDVVTVYVRKPVVNVVAPQGTITNTTHPVIRWEDARLEQTGGPQTRYQVKVVDDATYGGGGFDINTANGDFHSGVVHSSDLFHDLERDDALIDDVYRSYVRIAQTINGNAWWSDWAWKGWTLGTPRPGIPTFSLTPEDLNGRMKITMQSTAGGLTTEYFQVHRQVPGKSWEGVRTSLGDRGFVARSGTNTVLYDYEGRNNQTINYRVRALNLVGATPLQPDEQIGDRFVFSNFTATQSGAWTDTRWHFKHPYDSTLNLQRELRSQPGRDRNARAEVFQPLGSETAIVVSDTYTPWSGELIVRNSTDGERDAWDRLIADGLPLLVHAPEFVADWKDSWCHISEHSRERQVDSGHPNFTITWDRVAWTAVGRPIAAQPDNPTLAIATEPTTPASSTESP
jgi:hypothetical protein